MTQQKSLLVIFTDSIVTLAACGYLRRPDSASGGVAVAPCSQSLTPSRPLASPSRWPMGFGGLARSHRLHAPRDGPVCRDRRRAWLGLTSGPPPRQNNE
jgi:hypothetical protein